MSACVVIAYNCLHLYKSIHVYTPRNNTHACDVYQFLSVTTIASHLVSGQAMNPANYFFERTTTLTQDWSDRVGKIAEEEIDRLQQTTNSIKYTLLNLVDFAALLLLVR